MYSISLCSYGRFSCRQLIVWFWRMLSSSFLCTGFTATLLFLSCISDSSHMPASLIFFSFYICDLKNSYAGHKMTSPVFTGPNHPYIHPPSVDLCNSCSIWCVCVWHFCSYLHFSLFIALQSLKWKPYTLCITALRYSTHSWLIMFILLTHSVCVRVRVCVLTVWLLFWMRLHEFLIPSAICADAVTKAHGKCSLGGYPLLPMCLEVPVSQHVIVNHNHRGRGRDTCIALFISTSHPLFFLLLLLFIMLFSNMGLWGGLDPVAAETGLKRQQSFFFTIYFDCLHINYIFVYSIWLYWSWLAIYFSKNNLFFLNYILSH